MIYRICSYNINGIERFCNNKSLKSLCDYLIDDVNNISTIICLQEIKSRFFSPEMHSIKVDDYYFIPSLNYYAGVTSLFVNTKQTINVPNEFIITLVKDFYDLNYNLLLVTNEYGDFISLSKSNFESIKALLINEGRMACTIIDNKFMLLNIYLPAKRNSARSIAKTLIIVFLIILTELLCKTLNIPIVFAGDFNSIYLEHDSTTDRVVSNIFKIFVTKYNLIDLGKDHCKNTFWKESEMHRKKNIGSRIDYIFYYFNKNCNIEYRHHYNDDIDYSSDHNCIINEIEIKSCSEDVLFKLDSYITETMANQATYNEFKKIFSKYVLSNIKTVKKKQLTDYFLCSQIKSTIRISEINIKNELVSSDNIDGIYSTPNNKSFAKINVSSKLLNSDQNQNRYSVTNQLGSSLKQKNREISKIYICATHKVPCVIKRVRKKTINEGRYFASCEKDSCNFFQWIR